MRNWISSKVLPLPSTETLDLTSAATGSISRWGPGCKGVFSAPAEPVPGAGERPGM